MAHDPSKVLLGSVGSSIREFADVEADPDDFVAGLAVRRSASGLQIEAGENAYLAGVSCGPSPEDPRKKTRLVVTGMLIPLRLKNAAASVKVGNLTFTSNLFGAAGNDLRITLVDALFDADAEIATDPDSPLEIIIEIEDGATSAEAIAHAIMDDADTSELISVAIDAGEEETEQDASAEAPFVGGEDFVFNGAVVKIDADTGEGSADGTATNAIYSSNVLTGFYAEGSEHPAAYIAMPGGF